MNFKKLWDWLVYSSADPLAISRTVKAVGVVIALFAGHALADQFTNAALSAVLAWGQAFTSTLALWYATLKVWNIAKDALAHFTA